MAEWVEFVDKLKEEFNMKDDSLYMILIYTDDFIVERPLTLDNWDEKIIVDKLLDVRVFNKNKELRMYRDYVGNTFKDIIIISDDEMREYESYYDEQFLDVDIKRTDYDSGKIKATGGGIYSFPYEEKNDIKDIKVRLKNYISYDDNGQAYIIAWRLVEFLI